MIDPRVYEAEKLAGVYDDLDQCVYCDSDPCQCDSIYELANDK